LDIWQIVILALLQGLTEFLPISSSAHLILVPELTGWQDQGVAFDVAVHVGALIAVISYFRHELQHGMQEWWRATRTGQQSDESRLMWGVVVGTLPVGVVGLAFTLTGLDDQLRAPLVIASSTLLFGLLLWWGDKIGKQNRDEYSLSWQDITLIGMGQALALIPGTSRSGITITVALLLGLHRQAAARFSFLLSIPVIILAGLSAVKGLLSEENVVIIWSDLFLGMSLSAISAYLCIHFFIKMLNKMSLLPFVVYRMLLGVFLLWYCL